MEGATKKRRLLFLAPDTPDPTTRRRVRSKPLDSKIRQHLMVDIGKSRRKPSKVPHFVTTVWSLAETSTALLSINGEQHSTSRDEAHLQVPVKASVTTETAVRDSVPCIYPQPILHNLSVFEKEWGEDSFSAYGFALIMIVGKNGMGSTCSTNTFWFPLAFRQSAFLNHYKHIFTSANVLIPLYLDSATKLRCLALERSLETVRCIESRMSSSHIPNATSDSVLQAVLALVCYNFTSLDFDQAMIHMRGLWIVIATRGGISTLESNKNLMVMISWVDITAALLHDSKPLFPLLPPLLSTSVYSDSRPRTLPAPLLNVIDEENTQNTQFMNIMFSISDLNALTALIRLESATRGDTIWEDEEQIGLLMNPVTHRILNQASESEPLTYWDIFSEALRLGALIWIIRVKRRCRSYPGTAESRISTLLKMLSSESNTEHIWKTPDLRLVRLWLLVLCSISEPSYEDVVTSMEIIASEMMGPRSLSWARIMADVRQMPWVDIFDPPCAQLGQRLMEHLSENHTQRKHTGTAPPAML